MARNSPFSFLLLLFCLPPPPSPLGCFRVVFCLVLLLLFRHAFRSTATLGAWEAAAALHLPCGSVLTIMTAAPAPRIVGFFGGNTLERRHVPSGRSSSEDHKATHSAYSIWNCCFLFLEAFLQGSRYVGVQNKKESPALLVKIHLRMMMLYV